MHYIVDTYNLLHTAAGMGGSMSGATVRLICQHISASAASVKVTLVLDGRAKPDEPSENEFPDIDLVYSGAGVKADTVIEQIVERSRTRKKLTVVSNDRAVALHARRHFAHAMSCETFITQLSRKSSRPGDAVLPARKTTGTPTAGESDQWMKEFGLETPPPIGNPPSAPPKKQVTGDPEIDKLDIEGLLGPPGM